MELQDIFRTIFSGFRTNKIRSGLTILGIVIGIGSVIVIYSVGAGAQSLILDQVKSAGSNLIGVLPGAADDNGPPAGAFGVALTTLTYDDAQAIANPINVPDVTEVSAYVRGIDTVSSETESITGNFMGVSSTYPDVETAEVDLGRFFTLGEEKGMARVVVLGSQVRDQLFGSQDPIGRMIKIKREAFEVIGVLKPRGSNLFSSQDDQVFVPVTSAQKLLLGINHIGFLRAKVGDESRIETAKEDIKTILRVRHRINNPADDDFSVRDTAQALSVLGNVTDALKFFLAGIGALSLLVGGVGIMNVMLIAVSERTREIGLRMALGARRKDILTHFLIESALLALVGGVVGVLGGVILSTLIAVTANALGYSWHLVISPASILVASAVATAIGLVFGFYPARRASGLDPIRALRYE